MKVDIKEEKGFRPIKVTLTLESMEDLQDLYDTLRVTNRLHSLYLKINSIYKQLADKN